MSKTRRALGTKDGHWWDGYSLSKGPCSFGAPGENDSWEQTGPAVDDIDAAVQEIEKLWRSMGPTTRVHPSGATDPTTRLVGTSDSMPSVGLYLSPQGSGLDAESRCFSAS